jgi:protoporphyrinogen oxidase
MNICILGAGLTGLTLGDKLNQKMASFEILEKNSECGGLMRTLHERGFTFDFGGSHIIFSKDKEILNMLTALLGNNKIKIKRNTKIFYKGRYIKYPFENGLSDLSKNDNFECLWYFIQNLIEKEKGRIRRPINLKEWIHYTFGKGIAEKYIVPYNEKIWKFPTDRMSLEWIERIPNPQMEDIIRSSLGIDTEGYTHQLNFYYPKVGGIQALIRSLESKIAGHIVTNFDVKKIWRFNEKWIVSNGQEERSYDKIISTIPLHYLVAALDAPERIINAANNLKYNSLITVMVGLEETRINNLTWLYISDKNYISHRISFPSNYSRSVTPDGKSSLLAEITCNIGDEIWRMKDKDITERVIEDLQELKIINKKDICYTNIKRLKYAYVINDLNYKNNIIIINEYMQELGIGLLGRFSEFKYLNMDGCIKSVLDYLENDSTLTKRIKP